MSAFVAHDPAAPIADGRTIIEASAGTGKTYTIAAEVTRLVATEGIELGEILVVTFTRAATAELKSRVRGRMRTTMRVLQGREQLDGGDGYIEALLALDEAGRAEAAGRLAAALTHFDDAQIFTIHGFAQRLLTHLGFRSRIAPDLEPGEIDRQLLTQVASDALVGRFADNAAGEEEPKLNALLEVGKAVVGTPDATIVPGDPAAGIVRTRVEMAHEMKHEMTRRLRAGGQITFDDGLVEARDALADAEVGEAARSLLRRSYLIALVDEAQDTDPVQWQIIRSVFDTARMVVVGDPKQSIYSFRGADVESYLAAASGADARRTLGTNWRSDGPLLTALDALFEGTTFGDDRIEYRSVEPAPGHVNRRLDDPHGPLSIHRFGPDFPLKRKVRTNTFYVDEARQAVAYSVAAEIVALLACRAQITDENRTATVTPADIAVLCRTRVQVNHIRDALRDFGVPSVTSRTGGVYMSAAAEEWRRFLLAVERPDRADVVRLAATSLLFGLHPEEVAGLSDTDVLDLQHRFNAWQTLLRRHGVPALVADLHHRRGLAARVLSEVDGERLMTDLGHIAEEMHAVYRRGRTGSLASWIEAAMAESTQMEADRAEEPESRQRRLETDADAVQVQTIHGSKGLEYPVVFVPFAWDRSPRRPAIPVFHDPQAVAGDTPRPRLIDVGGPDGDEFGANQALAMAEDEAEEGRLLYVALTRAKHRLHVWWLEDADNVDDAKLTELIRRNGRGIDDLLAAAGGTIDAIVHEDLAVLASYEPPVGDPATLDRARFDRPLDHAWQRASFTSLSSEHPLTNADTTDGPLRADEETLEEDDPEPMTTGEAIEMPMAELPRGARFGTLVHEVLEHVAFDAPDLHTAVATGLADATHGSTWDFDSDNFITGIVAAMETPLGPDAAAPRLRDLDTSRIVHELSFDLPVCTSDGAVTLAEMADVFLRHLSTDDPYRPFGEQLQRFAPRSFRGYLAGAIDLTAEIMESDGPRYIVMDYKSNTLPMLGDVPAPADYGSSPLAAAMRSGNYVLQATLYQVALHRYLQWRLPGYDPDEHLGGSMYLFVRGMVGADTPVVDGERCGVARWHPPSSFVVAMSDLFKGGGS